METLNYLSNEESEGVGFRLHPKPQRKVSAVLRDGQGRCDIKLKNGENYYSLDVQAISPGSGGSLQGCEILCLALAVCYEKDVRREAESRGIVVDRIEVEVESQTFEPGETPGQIIYRAKVAAQASEEIVYTLMIHADHVAEIMNMLRVGTPVTLSKAEVIPA